MNKLSKYCFIGLTALLLLGCEPKYEYAVLDANATLQTEEAERLSRRHLAYWEYFSKHDFEASYKYELPYMHFTRGLDWYTRFHANNAKFYKITLEQIRFVSEEEAIVRTRFQNKRSSHLFMDRWWRVQGEWYHEFQKSKLPTPK